ncbi:MAG: hypothetical protein KBT58_12940 [Bizionia sp.]|nr:hypothetical protein [Bizionia sp.]
MKKRKCKQYLKLVMLLFGVTFVLSSCQKDDDLIQIEQNKNSNQTDFIISKIDKSKLAENTTLTRKLTKLSSNLRNKKSNNSQNKTLVSNEYGFTINTSYATYIESVDKTYHSYTFYIQRDVEIEMLENLLVSLEPDGTYKTSIISYNITAAEKEDISNNIYVDITNKVSSTVINDEGIISDIFNKAADCSGYVLLEWCSGPAGHDGANNYADCTAYNSDRMYYGCGFPGGGGSTAGSTGNTSPNTGDTSGSQTNNGGSGGSSSNGGVTTPTTPCRGDDCPEALDDSTPNTPCDELDEVSKTPSKLINLKNSIGLNQEVGFTRTDNIISSPNSTVEYQDMIWNTNSYQLLFNPIFDGQLFSDCGHTHYDIESNYLCFH